MIPSITEIVLFVLVFMLLPQVPSNGSLIFKERFQEERNELVDDVVEAIIGSVHFKHVGPPH